VSLFVIHQKTCSFHYKVLFQSPREGLLWVDLPKTKLQAPPNGNNKHCKSRVFAKILDVMPSWSNAKTLIEDFLTTVMQSSGKGRKSQ